MIRTGGRDGPLVRLSYREADIVRHVAENLRPVDIALELDLSEKTVSDYIFRITQALRLGSRQDLLVWAWQNPQAIGPDRLPARIGLHKRGCGCDAMPCVIARSVWAVEKVA